MRPCVAAVGTFDGIHVGHKAIVDKVIELANERNMASRVVTFINHPLSIIAPERCPKWITSRAMSELLLQNRGVERVSHLHFTAELMHLTAVEFMRLLRERYGVEVLVMGYDNTFGSDRLKNHEDYVGAGREAGIEVVFVDRAVTGSGETPSSSAVRHAIAGGDVERILDLLDEELVMEGKVEGGKRNGHRLGYPTMNINMDGCQPLREGVYAAVYIPDVEDMSIDYTAVLNVGRNPTIGDGNPLTYEMHVVGMSLDEMYGETVHFVVGPRLRGEQKFKSLKELVKAIRNDIRNAKAIYG